MAESLYLLDAHSLIFQVFHAIPSMTGPKGQPTNAVFGFTGDLLRIRRKQPTYLVCAFDPPGKTFRDALYAEYKADRAPMPDDLHLQIPVIFRILEAMRVPMVAPPGYEADDAIATIARQAEQRGIDVFVCTGDKDCRQLISDHVRVYNLRKDQVMGRDQLLADWGIAPEQVVDLLALVGDSVDNVPGVPGIGMKTGQKLLQQFGDIEGILANVEQIKGAKIRENLERHAPALELSRKLVRLAYDVPVTCDWDTWRVQSMDVPALLTMFQECGLHRYANEVRTEQKSTSEALPSRDRKPPGDLPLLDGAPSAERQPQLFESAWQAQYQLVDTPDKFDALLQELKKQKRIAIDLETTGRDPQQAEIIGYAFCWKPGEAYYLPVTGPAGQAVLDANDTLDQLRPILESDSVAKVNQNIKFDLVVLRRAGVELAGIAGDCMVASYLLTSGERNHNLEELSSRYLGHVPKPIGDLIGKGKAQRALTEVDTVKRAEYAGKEADIAWRLCNLLEPKLQEQGLDKLYEELEIPLVAVLAEVEYNGIRIDVPLLRRLGDEFAEQLLGLEREIYEAAGHAFNIGSPKQLRQVLFDELKLPAQRKTSITGEASTGQEVLEELAANGHDLPRKIIDYRQIAKLKGTYVDALPALVNPVTGRVHASFNQTVAATGRLSSSDPNLQNIPVRTEQGRQIRQAFIAENDNWVLLTADYSQIELRMLAHYSEDEELRRAFANDRDIHEYVAGQIYGVAEEQVNSEQRRNAKTVNFGVLYGLSSFGLAKRLGIPKDEAATFIDAYFARYPGVAEFQTRLLADAKRNGYVTTILGRRRLFESSAIRAHSTYRQRNATEREVLNSVLQGSAADLIKRAMLNIYRRLRRQESSARMLLQIHDELVFEVPRTEKEAVAELVAEEMTSALELSVPLKVDVAAGGNWLDVEPIQISLASPASAL